MGHLVEAVGTALSVAGTVAGVASIPLTGGASLALGAAAVSLGTAGGAVQSAARDSASLTWPRCRSRDRNRTVAVFGMAQLIWSYQQRSDPDRCPLPQLGEPCPLSWVAGRDLTIAYTPM